jgi:hypothetical protein
VSQLKQKMAMGMRKCDADRILRIFNWTEIDEAMLTQLSYRIEGGGVWPPRSINMCASCLSFSLLWPWSQARTSQTTLHVSGS